MSSWKSSSNEWIDSKDRAESGSAFQMNKRERTARSQLTHGGSWRPLQGWNPFPPQSDKDTYQSRIRNRRLNNDLIRKRKPSRVGCLPPQFREGETVDLETRTGNLYRRYWGGYRLRRFYPGLLYTFHGALTIRARQSIVPSGAGGPIICTRYVQTPL